ncbi:PfkB family carbohydrate kinase [Nocardioides yefusunii]|uniref:PfkB family carbohydrate kinase n=1 Tax=Nocardioides yefusunii TaxID=2500546 RepID=A0ABW1QYU5_9ACTN|nr:PfkB family carbohydrate kinase [Nocardioides yefusunii]
MPSSTPAGLFVGRSVLDVIQLVDTPAPVNGKVRSTRHTVAAGGPATNAAVLFAALGGEGHLVSRIADDPLGDALKGDLLRHGQGRITHHNTLDADETDYMTVPASVQITAATGDRSVIAGSPDPRANSGVLDRSFDHLLTEDVRVVLVDNDETDVSRALCERARALGIPTVLDAGTEKDVVPAQLPGIDSAIVAEDFHDATPDAIVDYLQAAGVPYGAVTRGGQPLRWFTPQERGWTDPAPVAKVVDTLGAGDFFHGAYAFAIARTGLTPESHVAALEWACHASSLSIAHFGTRTWLAHLDELPPLG